MAMILSKDKTPIAFDQQGQGPAVILVAAALSDRSDTARLARQLASHFTVFNYDRRGRGESGDNPPYATDREVEDIEALVDAAGGSAYIFGTSSGAVLALEAANRLNGKIKKLVLFEPPLIVDDSQPPVSRDLASQIERLVDAQRRSDAVRLFFARGMNIPAIGVLMLRFMPGWSKMTGMAHTIAYDLAILQGIQDGKPLPARRWENARSPALILTGEKSEEFFHNGAGALAALLPHAQHRILKGQHHGSVNMAPQAFADTLVEFFNA